MIVETEFDLLEFKRRLKEIRESRGYTQVQLGEMIGVSGNTISNWEMPSMLKARPDVEKLRRFCIATNCPPGYFLGLSQANISSEEHDYLKGLRELDDDGWFVMKETLKVQRMLHSKPSDG